MGVRIVSANGKGGAGKSSVTANLAALMAERGARVLVVDLDPQSNQAEVCFGFEDHDDGYSLHQAALTGDPGKLAPLPVRERIDLLPSGLWTAQLGEDIVVYANALARKRGKPRLSAEERAEACGEVDLVLGAAAENYDVVLIDTPPAYGNTLAITGLIAADYLIVPSRAGKMSRKGLEKLVHVYAEHGSPCTLLGIVLLGVNASSTSLVRSEMKELAGLFGADEPPLLGVIRDAEKATFDQEEHGLLAVEYLDAARTIGRRSGARFAGNIESLVEDYRQIADAVSAAMTGDRAVGAA